MTPDQIREQYAAKVEKIRGRQDLTPHARQVALARAHKDVTARLQAAQQTAQKQYETRRAQLDRRLFGSEHDVTGTDAISRRQAREMAAKLTDPAEAQAAYSRALRDGDRDYARAIASHAADQSSLPLFGEAWKDVVAAHAEATPGRADTYREFAELREPGQVGDWTFAVPSPASEIGRLSSGQINALAESELTVHGSDGPEAA